MEPTLRAGDQVVVDRNAYRSSTPAPRDVVLVRDPRDHGRTLVKRIAGPYGEGLFNVSADADDHDGLADSRTFGPVTRESIIGKVRWRCWKRPGPVR
jgi:signal peptidase I